MQKKDLPQIILQALKSYGGKANVYQVSKFVWENYKEELKNSGNLFYTWQYDIRWAATQLRKDNIMKQKNESPKGVWELAEY